MLYSLTLIENHRVITQVFDQESVTIGRSSSNDFRPDPARYSQVSRQHGCVTRVSPREFMYEDLGSTQGSFLDGRHLDGRVFLSRDDVVVLGRDGPSISVGWPRDRITGQGGTHYRITDRMTPAFPLAFSQNFTPYFNIYEKIGAGGFGEVWRAKPLDGGPDLAIKLLHPTLMNPDHLTEDDRDSLVRRFTREAQVTHRLSQSGVAGIVPVHSWGDDPDRDYLYLIMDYIEGMALDKLIRSGEWLSYDEIIVYFCQVAAGLDAAHNFEFVDENGQHCRGVIHRDIKPGNLLVDRDNSQAWILDFGVAGFAEGGDRLTCSNVAVGTQLYLPPEVMDSYEVSASTDLWAFAITLYLTVTGGRYPYPPLEHGALWSQISETDYVPVETIRPDVPRHLADAIHQGLAIDADKRLSAARDWLDVLAP